LKRARATSAYRRGKLASKIAQRQVNCNRNKTDKIILKIAPRHPGHYDVTDVFVQDNAKKIEKYYHIYERFLVLLLFYISEYTAQKHFKKMFQNSNSKRLKTVKTFSKQGVIQVLNSKQGITLRVSVTTATILTAKRTIHKNT